MEWYLYLQGVYDFYHFSAKAGRTRFSFIHLGRDKRTQEDVAIYAVKKTSLPLPKMMILTKRDPSVLDATQSHDSLLRVHDLFESSVCFYIITELVNGIALSNILSAPLPEKTTLDLMADILQGLHHLHAQDIVHGNIDAENIICVRHNLPSRVKIVTYGNATAWRDIRLLGGRSLKEWRRLAPEVVCFQRRTTASDIFAAGILLYRMLSGSHPFDEENEAVYLAHVSRGISKDEMNWDGVSDEAKGLVCRMLDDDASARPSASDCLSSSWFRDSIADGDPADNGEEIVRTASDPKTVIMDFEMGKSLGTHAISSRRKVDIYDVVERN